MHLSRSEQRGPWVLGANPCLPLAFTRLLRLRGSYHCWSRFTSLLCTLQFFCALSEEDMVPYPHPNYKNTLPFSITLGFVFSLPVPFALGAFNFVSGTARDLGD